MRKYLASDSESVKSSRQCNYSLNWYRNVVGVATSRLALRWMYDSPRTGCERRITPMYICVAKVMTGGSAEPHKVVLLWVESLCFWSKYCLYHAKAPSMRSTASRTINMCTKSWQLWVGGNLTLTQKSLLTLRKQQRPQQLTGCCVCPISCFFSVNIICEILFCGKHKLSICIRLEAEMIVAKMVGKSFRRSFHPRVYYTVLVSCGEDGTAGQAILILGPEVLLNLEVALQAWLQVEAQHGGHILFVAIYFWIKYCKHLMYFIFKALNARVLATQINLQFSIRWMFSCSFSSPLWGGPWAAAPGGLEQGFHAVLKVLKQYWIVKSAFKTFKTYWIRRKCI